ncbi:MAG TPA: outer membrane beta-barrel protein [Saprospiraceae bacterium]|nr:outer membrane beta-barrel protein [Saprospiraceae bacterium]
MRINTYYLTVLPAAFFLLPMTAQSQQTQRFKAGIIAGVTASQIDGDESAGYHKIGLQAGLKGIAILKPKQQASVEILYTQRGCRNEPETYPLYNTTLNYIEVPLQWHYSDWLVEAGDEADNFYRVQFNVGASWSYLLGYKDKYEDGFGIAAALPDLNKNSFCGMLGISFYATKNIGFTFRWQRAFNNLYTPKDGTNYASSLNEHSLTFQTMFVF